MLDVTLYLYEDGDGFIAEDQDEIVRVRMSTPESALAGFLAAYKVARPEPLETKPFATLSFTEALRQQDAAVVRNELRYTDPFLIRALLYEAAANETDVWIEGTNIDDTPMASRRVSVNEVDGNILRAYDVEADDYRSFRIDNLTAVSDSPDLYE